MMYSNKFNLLNQKKH